MIQINTLFTAPGGTGATATN